MGADPRAVKAGAHTTWAALLLLCPGCATTALWVTTAPETRAWIAADRLTPAEFEAYCARRGLAGEAVPGGYLVEKSRPHKRADVAVRIAATPIALAIDAASGAALAGAVLFTCCPEIWLELAAEAANGGD